MKKAKTAPAQEAHQCSPEDCGLLPEYDFSGGMRGKYYRAIRKGYRTVVHHTDGSKTITYYRVHPQAVVLDPDVQAYFPNAEAVNTVLRGLMALIPTKRRRTRKATTAAKE